MRARILSGPNASGEVAVELWDGRAGLAGLSLEAIFPGLGATEGPNPSDGLGARSKTLLQAADLDEWGLLAAVTLLELADVPRLGRASFVEVIGLVLETWADAGVLPEAFEIEPFVERLRTVLHWSWRDGGAETVESAARAWDGDIPPDTVVGSARSIGDIRLEAFLGVRPCDEATWLALLDLEPREITILSDRVLVTGKAKQTLGQLGEALNVTRERVRQVEASLVKKLDARLLLAGNDSVHHLSARLAAEVGGITDEATLQAATARLVTGSSGSPVALRTALRTALLRHLAGPYGEHGDLLTSPKAGAAIDAARLGVEALPLGALPDAVLLPVAAELVGREDLEGAVYDLLGVRRYGEHTLVWRGSHPDMASSVLDAEGVPMTMSGIRNAVGRGINLRSLARRIQRDPRFIRLGKDSYGLAAWGGEAYAGIGEEWQQAIERGGGEVGFEETVAALVETFGVSESSVRTSAAGRRFIRDGDTIRLRADSDAVVLRGAPIEMTAGAFRVAGRWHLRVELGRHALRGSGHAIRQGVAIAAGLEPDKAFEVDIDGFDIVFSWTGKQPVVGSVRLLVQHYSCMEGDLLFIPLEGAEPRTARVVRAADRAVASGARRFALELAIDPDGVDFDDRPGAVGAALGLDEKASWDEVVERLALRGDKGLLEWLPSEIL